MFSKKLTQQVRGKFTLVDRDSTGRKRIFFDAGAGTRLLASSAKAMAKTAVDYAANTGSNYPESAECEKVILEGRRSMADFLNAEDPKTMVAGESSTGLLFHLSYAIGKETSQQNNVVSTYMEHLADASPWFELERRGCVKEARWVALNDDSTLNMDDLKSKIDQNTKVVSVALAANLFGTKSNLKEIVKIAHDVGAYVVVDAVHHAPHGPIDVQDLGCDFLVVSMYKVFSPKYICFMYGKPELLKKLNPYSVERNVTDVPDKWEFGSPDPSKFAAVSATIEYLVWLSKQVTRQYKGKWNQYSGRVKDLKIAMAAIDEYEKNLSKATLTGKDGLPGLPDIPGIEFYGLRDVNHLEDRDPTFAFRIPSTKYDQKEIEKMFVMKYGIDLRYVFDSWNMAHNFLNIPAMARASMAHYNTVEEVYTFLKAANAIAKKA